MNATMTWKTATDHACSYYAGAINDDGRIGILLVTRANGRATQEWTGETFPDTRRGFKEAEALITERNCAPKERS